MFVSLLVPVLVPIIVSVLVYVCICEKFLCYCFYVSVCCSRFFSVFVIVCTGAYFCLMLTSGFVSASKLVAVFVSV